MVLRSGPDIIILPTSARLFSGIRPGDFYLGGEKHRG
jgi:hypothetical protein